MKAGYVIDWVDRKADGTILLNEKFTVPMKNATEAIKNFKPLKELGQVSSVERVKEER